MITKINRVGAFKQYQSFPWVDFQKEVFFDPISHKDFTLTVPSKSTKGLARNLSASFAELIQDLGFHGLVFLGETARPWLYQYNDYKPAKEAYQYLENLRIGKRFNGALWVETCDLKEFTKNLFWLQRCNASLPFFHFLDTDQKILGYFCQYGNIHLSVLNELIMTKVSSAVIESNFSYLEKC